VLGHAATQQTAGRISGARLAASELAGS
jgi:hypothetical protein